VKIIYPNEYGIAVLTPAPKFLDTLEGMSEEEQMTHLADKDLESGQRYEIVADDYPPSDRAFRDAWEYVAGADEQVSEDLSLDDQLKYNHISQEEYDAANS
jgi:hypothetical protein